jgi:hypothetical protein
MDSTTSWTVIYRERLILWVRELPPPPICKNQTYLALLHICAQKIW